MYTVIPQNIQEQNFWGSSTSSCSEIDENDSDISFEIKEEDHFNFMNDILKNELSLGPQTPERNGSLSSSLDKCDKMIQEQHIGLIGSTTIKSEIIGNDERTMMHSQNIQQMMHQQSNLHHHNQQMPEGFNITSNNAQPSNNDGMDIYRDLILRHLVQDISTTCSKLYLPTNPYLWTVDHTNRWIIEMCQQFQLSTPSCQFNITGKDLLQMSQEELMSRIPEGGDTIHAQLHLWSTAYESSQSNNPQQQQQQQQSCGLIHHSSTDSMSSGWNSPTTPNKMSESYSDYYDHNSDSIQNMNAYYNMQQTMQYPHHQQQQQINQLNQVHQQQRQQQQRHLSSSGSPNSFFMCNQQTMPSPSDSDISSSSSCLQDDDEFSESAYLPVNYGPRQQQCQINPENGYCMPVQNSLAQAHLAAGNGVQNPSFTRNTGTVHLWHFIRELLDQPKQYSSCVRWVDREEGTFKIESSHHLARFWGQRKNRSQMNYDKLSRSLRQYYKKGIIQKPEKKQRLVYKFLHPYNL